MTNFYRTVLATLFATLITACSGGGSSGGSSETPSTATSGSNATTPVTPNVGSGTVTAPTVPTTPTTPTAPSVPATPTAPVNPTAPTTPVASAHTVQLSWTIPSTRENGSALRLSELSGYEIYYYQEGTSSGAGEVVPVSGGTNTSTQVTINGSGTYYFAIAARDQAGLLSNLSNYVAANLN